VKSRPAPKPLKYGPRAALAHDPQVKKWVARMLKDPEARPNELSEEQLVYVYTEVLKRRGEEFDQTAFQAAMAETCPVIAAPKLTDARADLGLMMVAMAMSGTSEHADDIHTHLARTNWLADLFEELEADRLSRTQSQNAADADDGEVAASGNDSDAEPAVAAAEAGPAFSPGGYSTAMRLIGRLAPSGAQLAMAANVALLRSLRELLPHAGIGKRLLIDGSMVPAWCQQKGAGDDTEREQRLRRHTPEAGFRAYVQSGSEKRPIKPGDKLASGLRAGRGKAWRGYTLIVIADQATGLPLVWTLQDASLDEAQAIVPLLSDLHRLWPDIDAELIAGDSAWDEDAWCRVCEVDYGIHPVFRLHGKKVTKAVQDGESRDGSVNAYTHDGRLICAQHGMVMAYAGADVPSRNGLRPGESSDERKFRVRGLCDHDGPGVPPSKPGLRMKTDWSKLTFYPHHANGNPRRHAQRQAVLARLNQVEGLFNRLKAGRKLATPGAARTRIRDKGSVEALISLAMLSFTALTVVDQRQQHGQRPVGPTPVPDPPEQPKARLEAPGVATAAAGALAAAPRPEPSLPATIRRRGHLTLIPGGAR
jgi:hypothetical protein